MAHDDDENDDGSCSSVELIRLMRASHEGVYCFNFRAVHIEEWMTNSFIVSFTHSSFKLRDEKVEQGTLLKSIKS